MWNIIFTVLFCMSAAGIFDNVPIGWKIILAILAFGSQVILILQEHKQEELQDRVKSLENKVKKLTGEDK